MTTERIAAAIKPILDEDRRADRVRIAELERDLNTIRGDAGLVNDALGILDLVQAPEAIADLKKQLDEKDAKIATWMVAEDDSTVVRLNKQLDELNEKCAALVVERDRLIGEQMNDGWPCRSPTAVATPGSPEAPALRIDPDMSDPQPGKLLVVRLENEDIVDMLEGFSLDVLKRQRIGFLVETPAVKVETISGGVTTTNSPFPWESRK